MAEASTNRIRITEAEYAAGALSIDHCEDAARSLAADGYVVLNGAVDAAALAHLRQRMDQDTEALLAFQADHGGNPRAEGHLQQGPPRSIDYVSRTVTANPFAIAVSKAVLGAEAYLRFYNGNTNLPGSIFQAVHVDNGHLWPNSPMASPAYALVINISPNPCTAVNGATEIWPGTHLLSGHYEGNNVADALLEDRRVVRPPLQVETAVGDLVMRDTRLWHRGVPNRSDQPRHMVAAIHAAGWLHRERKVPFEMGCERAFDGTDFDFNAEFVDGDCDYLFGPTRQMYRREGHWRDDKAAAAREASKNGT